VPGYNVAPNNQLGDGVDANDKPFLPYFPYVAPPQDPRTHVHPSAGDDDRRGRGDRDSDRDGVSALGAGDMSAMAASAATKPELRLASTNPGPGAVLQYTVPATAHVQLAIFDVMGRTVRTLIDQDAAAGTFRATWDGRDGDGNAQHGVFFARMSTGGKTADTRKIVVE
jgi:hypothetical protein